MVEVEECNLLGEKLLGGAAGRSLEELIWLRLDDTSRECELSLWLGCIWRNSCSTWRTPSVSFWSGRRAPGSARSCEGARREATRLAELGRLRSLAGGELSAASWLLVTRCLIELERQCSRLGS